MTAYLLLGALLGWFGNDALTNSPSCTANPLIEASCPDLIPPSDPSFGATTYSLTTAVRTYKECRRACMEPKE